MLPADVLQRIANEDSKLTGLSPTDYGLAENERLGKAITRSWTRLIDIHKNFVDELAVADPTDTAAWLYRQRQQGVARPAIAYLDSPRHRLEVEHFAYRKKLTRLIGGLDARIRSA